MTDRTQEEIDQIIKDVFELEGRGEIQKPIIDYIELLQETIQTYQGELYAKNSQISSLEYKLANIKTDS